jgi:hypothetical protein
MEVYHCKAFDIIQAFTYGRPDRHVHLEFPAGMQQEYGKDGDRKCKYLNFNPYGPPSGPRCWNVALHNKFLKMGFDQSTTDPSLYKRGELHACVFVDDCLDALFHQARRVLPTTRSLSRTSGIHSHCETMMMA